MIPYTRRPIDYQPRASLRAAVLLRIALFSTLWPAALAQQTVTRTYTYDANGAVLSRSDHTRTDRFVHDAQDRLVAATLQTTTAAILQSRYDVNDDRIATSVNGVNVDQLVDSHNPTGFSQVIEHRDRASNLNAAYTLGQDRLGLRTPADHRFYHSDGPHSTRHLTSTAGQPTDSYRFDAFGNTLAAAGASANDCLFAGEQFDADTDTYYLRARNYAPGAGRFTSLDPFTGAPRRPQSLHTYAYAHSDPVNQRDPTGLFSMTELMVSVSIVGVMSGAASYGLVRELERASVRADVVSIATAVRTLFAFPSDDRTRTSFARTYRQANWHVPIQCPNCVFDRVSAEFLFETRSADSSLRVEVSGQGLSENRFYMHFETRGFVPHDYQSPPSRLSRDGRVYIGFKGPDRLTARDVIAYGDWSLVATLEPNGMVVDEIIVHQRSPFEN